MVYFRLDSERAKQAKLIEDIRGLQAQVDSAAAGLSAASRLSEQLDKKASIIATLKQVKSIFFSNISLTEIGNR